MKFDEKINALLAAGKLTNEQAEALRHSVAGAPVAAIDNCAGHRRLPMGLLLSALIAVSAIFYFMAFSGAPPAPQEIQNIEQTINQAGKVGEMNKPTSTIFAIVVLALPIIIWLAISHNSLVSQEEDVLVAWSQVETNYQRRADLIPNLLNTVKSFADHEGQTLTDIAKLRSHAEELAATQGKAKESAQGAVTKLGDDAYMSGLAKEQSQVSDQLKGLMVSVEAYPQLRSSDQYMELQAELEGTENRINVARMAFNEKVGEFNASIRRLPNNIMAAAGGFQRKAYFKSDEGANRATKLDFNSPVGR